LYLLGLKKVVFVPLSYRVLSPTTGLVMPFRVLSQKELTGYNIFYFTIGLQLFLPELFVENCLKN